MAECAAVSVVRWVGTLLLDTPALQVMMSLDDVIMRQLLPPVLVPLLDALHPPG